MSGKKYKKLTNKEKQLRKEVREELREKGVLPPVKPRLNRKKFAKETIEEFKNDFNSYDDFMHLHSAISWMLPVEDCDKVTPEEVGVLKLLKVALEIKKYHQSKRAAGETKYKPMELYREVVKPIKEL